MRRSNRIFYLKVFFNILVFALFHVSSSAQGFVNSFEHRLPSTQTELFFYSGYGSSIGINHLKDISPRTSVLIGASYTNFRHSPLLIENTFSPLALYNLRSEFRYYLTPKEKQWSAFIYAAVNSGMANNFMKPAYNLGLEVGGEVRYKIGENAYFSVRSSFYRTNGNYNPYRMNNIGFR